jgi:hypothetical protein
MFFLKARHLSHIDILPAQSAIPPRYSLSWRQFVGPIHRRDIRGKLAYALRNPAALCRARLLSGLRHSAGYGTLPIRQRQFCSALPHSVRLNRTYNTLRIVVSATAVRIMCLLSDRTAAPIRAKLTVVCRRVACLLPHRKRTIKRVSEQRQYQISVTFNARPFPTICWSALAFTMTTRWCRTTSDSFCKSRSKKLGLYFLWALITPSHVHALGFLFSARPCSERQLSSLRLFRGSASRLDGISASEPTKVFSRALRGRPGQLHYPAFLFYAASGLFLVSQHCSFPSC